MSLFRLLVLCQMRMPETKINNIFNLKFGDFACILVVCGFYNNFYHIQTILGPNCLHITKSDTVNNSSNNIAYALEFGK